ncbi:MAG: hypothetical protein FJ143_09400 [Deltaproteobacteria bacterium]|nr:hypothetical protein [Deltaproteobacteria bacterium]
MVWNGAAAQTKKNDPIFFNRTRLDSAFDLSYECPNGSSPSKFNAGANQVNIKLLIIFLSALLPAFAADIQA